MFVALLTLSTMMAAAADLQPAMDPGTGISLATDMRIEHQRRILRDLRYLSSTEMRIMDPEINRVMGIREANANTMKDWLGERISVIVSPDIDLSTAVQKLPENFAYPNQFEENNIPSGASAVVMTNIGAGLYLRGKTRNVLYGITIPGFSKIEIRSPRVGIVRVGDELFSPSLQRFGLAGNDVNSEPYTIQRLGTFFHEARHSDGNGEHLGFPHAVCPEGHDFAGIKACDHTQNGSYTVGALAIRAFLKSCKNCSVAELEVLKLKTLDSFNRVLESTDENQTKDWDPQPEGHR